MFVRPLNVKTEHFLKILFIADEDVDERHEFFCLLDCLFTGPQLAAKIQVVAHNRPGFVRRFHRLIRYLRTTVAQGGENSARVKPSRFSAAENSFPIDVGGFHVRNSGVPTVVHRHAGTHAYSNFGKIQADPVCAAGSVIGAQTTSLTSIPLARA